MFRHMIATLVVVSLFNITVVSMASGNEPAGITANQTARPVVDPADFYRSDLRLSEREKLEEQLVENIEHMLEQIDSQYPQLTPRPTIVITGFSDAASGDSMSRRFADVLWRHDINKLVNIMRQYLIEPTYRRPDNDTLVFESKLHASFGARLINAIEESDYVELENILKNDQVDLERYLPGIHKITPLLLAVGLDKVEAVQQLIAAGADPDKRDRGYSSSPLFLALKNGNAEIIRILGEAGADFNEGIGGQNRVSPIAWAIANDKAEHAALLIEFGANPNVTDYAGWTALMDAIFNEQIEVVDALLPLSDPRVVSKDDITRKHRYKNLGLRFLPSGNALFLARRMRSDRAAEIADALRARAAELDADTGLKLIELSAQRSSSRLAWFEGRKQASIDAHRAALEIVSVPSISELSNGELITQAMQMLTELHEMLLITGQKMTDEEVANVEHITGIGGWHAPLHDMLDILSAGQLSYPAEQLDAWFATNGMPSREDWNFDRLNTWVESITDERQRDRLFDVLDFFELKGWRR